MNLQRAISGARGKLERAALGCFDLARAVDPAYPQALFDHGKGLAEENRLEEALRYFDRGLKLRPADAEALRRRAGVLKRAKRAEEALASLDRALAARPDFPDALISRAIILRTLGEIGEALTCLRRAMELRPEDHTLHTLYLFTLNFDPALVEADKQRARAEWERRHAERYKQQWRPHDNEPTADRRLRVGYVSSFFCFDNSTFGFGQIILNGDPQRFEVFCYSDTQREDEATAILREKVHHFRRTRGMSDDQMAELIRSDRIDILIDCLGHMNGNRLLVFARKPAPVQATAFGEVTGTGLHAIDYLLGSRVLVPESDRALFAERVIDLPNFTGFWSPDPLPDVAPLPAIERGSVTFGSFNRLAKLSEPTIRCWAAILRRLPSARLVLKNRQLADPLYQRRILDAFAKLGVAPGALVFVGGTDRQTHFACYNVVDIALDPFPHSGGMTTLDALWMGVPVVSLPGKSVSSRWAATSLVPLGLEDFIAQSEEEYVELAVAKATDINSLAQLRPGLRARMASSEFGDGRRFCRAAEAAYLEMWSRWCRSRTRDLANVEASP